MPYQFQNFCHETLQQAVIDEIDNGALVVSNDIYSPASYTLGTDSAVITYQLASGSTVALTRVYPSCTDVGYPSITGLTWAEGISLNGSVILCWCIAYAFKSINWTMK